MCQLRPLTPTRDMSADSGKHEYTSTTLSEIQSWSLFTLDDGQQVDMMRHLYHSCNNLIWVVKYCAMKYFLSKAAKWVIIIVILCVSLNILVIIRQILLPPINDRWSRWWSEIFLENIWFRLIFYDDVETTVERDWSPENIESDDENAVPSIKLNIPTQNYFFHPSCNCSRQAPALTALQEHFEKSKQFWRIKLSEVPVRLAAGVYVGSSSCNDYSSALGSGQKVLSYTYYSPWRTIKKQYFENGKPTDTEERFLELLEPMAKNAARLYPGWRVRIYHNVTETDAEAFSMFCSLYCQHDFIDFCDTRQLPTVGDLNKQFPIGRFWR